MNIRLEYLYRDSGNYKKWGEVVFGNPSNKSAESVTQLAKDYLIDGEFFVATRARVPDLHFADWDSDLDHDWHEFAAFVATSDAPDDREQRTIDEFVESLRLASGAWTSVT